MPRLSAKKLLKITSYDVPPNLTLGLLTDESQGTLLSYYEDVISRMITTIDDAGNGFRNVLLPLALSSRDLSSQALLKATIALSAFHLGRYELAIQNKLAAIKALSASINAGTGSEAIQLAACMMLCVNSVFDASDDSWTIHLQGARTILQGSRDTRIKNSHMPFLLDWFAYHDVLQKYTLVHGTGSEACLIASIEEVTDPKDTEATEFAANSQDPAWDYSWEPQH
ncbi:uncharacterized protein PV09_06527 [Verruconis gallopava]|uniref:Transcription factor domain-containing protein n=1 Tax=Verruconis gallopava TaxID=253628 RepID=A0A0D1XIB2_9PEZI|nr:uncharacterized protein PV09_06527 [Verruconis gallopava]KIW02021.1 hypothetical protein PV09_06527 [Verruconis gallopava]